MAQEVTPQLRKKISDSMYRRAVVLNSPPKPVLVVPPRTYTIRQLAREVEKGTPFGIKQAQAYVMTAADLLKRGRRVTKAGETESDAILRVVDELIDRSLKAGGKG